MKEVKIPERPFPFEPNVFQKEWLEKASEANFPYLLRPRGRFVSIDMGTKEGDKGVAVRGIRGKNGGFTIVSIDEWGTFPEYKWWKNPIKWWQWRRIMKVIESSSNGRAK